MNDLFLDEIVRPDGPGGGSGDASPRRAERAERARRRKQRRRRSWVALLVVLAVGGGITYAVIKFVMPVVSSFGDVPTAEALDYPGPGHGSIDVSIPAGASGTSMASLLHEADVVQSERAFVRAFTADPGAATIQAGTYRLLQQMKASDVVAWLQDPGNRVQTKVTIPEGFRLTQILDRLSSVTAVPVEDFTTAMQDAAATGLPPEAEGNYEGWLFPATYSFEPGTSPTEMIAMMIAQTIAVLDENAVPAELREEVLIKASLVERESPNAEASLKMARAIENRIAKDMRLEIDAAIAYGVDKPGTELTRTDLDTDGPYNLRTRAGLPPTPIASPSKDSIYAVMHPADGPWIFWCTVNWDTGETRFTDNYQEHQANVAELHAWERANGMR